MTEPTDVETDTHLGTRVAQFEEVSGASARVEVPQPRTDDATLSVSGETYDDEPGHVVVRLGGGVDVEVALDAAAARQLAETLAAAADEAEADVETHDPRDA